MTGAVSRIEVLKELARMLCGAARRFARTLLVAIPVIVVALGGVYFATHVGPYWFVEAGRDVVAAVPEIVWTVGRWVLRILGLIITANILREVWTIARGRARERENDA